MTDHAHVHQERRPPSLADDLATCVARILHEPRETFAGAAEDRAVAGLGERLGAPDPGLGRGAPPARASGWRPGTSASFGSPLRPPSPGPATGSPCSRRPTAAVAPRCSSACP